MTDEKVDSEEVEESEELERARKIFEKTHKIARRVGYILLFGAGFVIFIPMVLGAINGVKNDRIWDPITGLPLSVEEPELECIREASDLMYLAGEYGEYEPQWEQRFRRWQLRCQEDYPEWAHQLTETRERLRGDTQRPRLDE